MENELNARNVLSMLLPNGGWVIYGEDFSTITYDEGVTPVTKEQFDEGFVKFAAWKAEQDAEVAAKKASAEAKLAALGLDADDLKVLGLG